MSTVLLIAALLLLIYLVRRYSGRTVIIAILLIFASAWQWQAGHEVLVVVTWILAFLGWLVSLRINGRIPHAACKGRGRKYGLIFRHRFRLCGCGGGRVISPAAARLGTPRVREEAVRQAEAIRNAGRWREPRG